MSQDDFNPQEGDRVLVKDADSGKLIPVILKSVFAVPPEETEQHQADYPGYKPGEHIYKVGFWKSDQFHFGLGSHELDREVVRSEIVGPAPTPNNDYNPQKGDGVLIGYQNADKPVPMVVKDVFTMAANMKDAYPGIKEGEHIYNVGFLYNDRLDQQVARSIILGPAPIPNNEYNPQKGDKVLVAYLFPDELAPMTVKDMFTVSAEHVDVMRQILGLKAGDTIYRVGYIGEQKRDCDVLRGAIWGRQPS